MPAGAGRALASMQLAGDPSRMTSSDDSSSNADHVCVGTVFGGGFAHIDAAQVDRAYAAVATAGLELDSDAGGTGVQEPRFTTTAASSAKSAATSWSCG